MSQARFWHRRTATQWCVRGALAVAVAVLGGVAVTRSAAWSIRSGEPARAHALSPGDGRITGLAAQALLIAEPQATDRTRVAHLARLALQQDPTAVAAVSTLGLVRQIAGDTAGARRLFAFAQTLSRRDLKTQIWAIEDAVGRGDVPGALRHYDIALRTARDAQSLLFPILSAAIADPPVRRALVTTLAARPAWSSHFMVYAAGEGAAPQATHRLMTDLRNARVPVPDAASAGLVDRLVGANMLEDAWAAYASFHPGADRRRSRDPGFAADPAKASPFDWRVVETPGLTGTIGQGEQGGAVAFAAVSTMGGPVVQQLQMLPAGPYQLDGRASGIEQPDSALPYWTLTCRDGRELDRVPIPSSRAGGTFSGRFVVPAGCPAQMLSLVIRPVDAVAGTSGQISRVRVTPIGPSKGAR